MPAGLDLAARLAARDELAQVQRRLELALAQRDGLKLAVAGLLRALTRDGGFMRHEDQVVLRAAKAMLAECGE